MQRAQHHECVGRVGRCAFVGACGRCDETGRYVPPRITNILSGNPDEAHISTSYLERQNLQMRMFMRRFTRLTNGHSKKVANPLLAIHYVHYKLRVRAEAAARYSGDERRRRRKAVDD